ncbi:MAG: hypothetical protein AVDCRST_MAG73-3549 [uncultured Thermomicrobiales bacterium]|uniref:YtkA-like domain-containing protein n=1 Tax=uncultured Thermomicrobiales bacterium TaxID=1645740 RepID=A0A6J4UVW3_9BACT|nr:MAG: hypothetical protein AVDCRST_MAG73-3549 [uncultured Thermomicrobiales bacterium]
MERVQRTRRIFLGRRAPSRYPYAMNRRIPFTVRVAVLVALIGVLTPVVTPPRGASAHETRELEGGRYAVEVGFLNEPAYLGQPNALYLDVVEFATGGGRPVEGLAATLQAEVQKDGQSMPLTLIPREPGVYHGAFLPTATGDYTFRLVGQIGDQTVDESFRSSPNTFAAVDPADAIQFPTKLVAADALQSRVASAEDEAAAARGLAIAGIAVGALGLIAAVAAVALGRAGRRGGRS